MAVGKLQRIPIDRINPEFLRGMQGLPGLDAKAGLNGRDGLDGLPGTLGERGEKGDAGLQGIPGTSITGQQGESGAIPEHQVRNGEIRFKNPDGTWGEWVNIGSQGGGGKISMNTYKQITTAEFHIGKGQLDLGTNIFGVDFAGDVTIFIPRKIDRRSIIVVNDESATAETNNITIKAEEL